MNEVLGGDWRRWRDMSRGDKARVIARRRVDGMLKAARLHDDEERREAK